MAFGLVNQEVHSVTAHISSVVMDRLRSNQGSSQQFEWKTRFACYIVAGSIVNRA